MIYSILSSRRRCATIRCAKIILFEDKRYADDAALILNWIPLTGTNYEVTWKLLAIEYDSLRDLVWAYLEAFVDHED